MKAKGVVEALRRRHGEPGVEWAFFSELRAGTGYRTYDYENKRPHKNNPEQRFDAWAINLYPSKNHLRIAYEVKVSRSDFLNEIKNPDKRQQALGLSNQFFFVAPEGLISAEEIPEECGLIEVSRDLIATIKKDAPWRKTEEPSWQFISSIARRASRAENEIAELKSSSAAWVGG